MNRPRVILLTIAFVLCRGAVAQSGTTAASTSAHSYRISGVVVDFVSGQPVSGAKVVIAPVTDRGAVKTTQVAVDGRFSFQDLPRGKYSLGAERRGYPGQGYDQHGGYATAIAVGPELESEHLVFRMRRSGTIRGTVTDENDEPVPGANVRLFGSGIANGESTVREVMRVSTDDRGDYSFAHLDEREYYVAVSGRPWYSSQSYFPMAAADPTEAARMKEERAQVDRVFPLTFYQGALSSEQATPIHVTPGESITADVVLRSTRNIHVRIPSLLTAEAGKESVGESESVIVRGQDGHRMVNTFYSPPQVMIYKNVFGTLTIVESMVSTMGEGVNELSGLPAGHYVMTIMRSTQAMRSTAGVTQEVDLEDGTELTLAGGSNPSTVNGELSIDGQPGGGEGLVVRLVGKGSAAAFATAVKAGKFEFSQTIPPGTYEVGLAGNQNDQYIKAIAVTGAKISGRALQISSGNAVKLSISAGAGMGQVDGTALNQGKPQAGAMIVLVPSDLANNATLVRRDQSDSDGTFTLPQIVPGSYRVLAILNGWQLAWSDPKALEPFLAKASVYKITSGSKLEVKVEVQAVK